MDIQEIAAFTALAIAIIYLIRKFLWKKKKSKDCGTDDNCGCH